MSMIGLRIEATAWQAMVAHADACLPEEACGLLAGRGTTARRAIPIENVEHSSTRYRMEPHAQIDAMLGMEREGEALIAIFHSHPKGPAGLSDSDRMQAHYPESFYIVLSPASGCWKGNAFRLDAGKARPVPMIVDEAGTSDRA